MNKNKTTERLVAIDTLEVSLVDKAANEKEFLLKKNQENEMSENLQQTNEDSVVKIPVDDNGVNVAKAMEHVDNIIANISKSMKVEPQQKVEDSDDKDLEKSDSNKDNSDVKDVSKLNLLDVFKNSGLEEGQLKVVSKKLSELGLDPNKSLSDMLVEKSENDKDDESETEKQNVEKSKPFTMEDFQDAIMKASKFTPEKIEEIQKAHETLGSVLNLVDNSDRNTNLKDSKKIEKVDDGNVKLINTIKSLGETIQSMNERIESIEKIRQPSNSSEEDGETDKNVEKSNKLNWKGFI